MNISPDYSSECSSPTGSSTTLSPLCWTGYDNKLGFFEAEVRDESQFILQATEQCIYSVEAKLDEERSELYDDDRSCSIALSDDDDGDLYLLPGVVALTQMRYSIFPYFKNVVQWFSENVNVLSAEELLERRSLIAYDVLCVVEHRDGTVQMTPAERCQVVDEAVGLLIDIGTVAEEWCSMAQSELGSVLIAKLFEFGDDAQRQNLMELFLLHFGYAIYSNPVGAKLVQRISGFLSEDLMKRLVDAIQREHEQSLMGGASFWNPVAAISR